jgi:regulator of sigma E protease
MTVHIIEIIIGLLVLILLVVAHEFGHAFAARKNGVVVEEFGVGLPPAAKKKKLKSGLVLSLNWLPIGGFVKLQGEYDAADKKGDYGAATFWQKTKILFAGVFANWLVAAILLTILALVGMPKIIPNQFSVKGDSTSVYNPIQIVSLIDDGAAKTAGLEVGDEILEFADEKVSVVDGLIKLSKNYQDQAVSVVYKRGDDIKSTSINLGNESEDYIIGARLGQSEYVRSTWSAPIVGVATTAQFTWLTVGGIGSLLANIFTANMDVVGDSVSGPIGILGSIFPSAVAGGIVQLILLSAIVSLSLAVMNILPIPALDGGRWTTMTVYKLMKKKLTKEREEKIQAAGFFFLMALIILVTYNDIAKLF